MARIFWENHIPRAAAGLSYFLTLSVFPMLICLYNMLGSMFPATDEIRGFLELLLPAETGETILEFLRYVSNNMSSRMLVMALVVVATSSSAGYRTIDNVVGEMRGVGTHYSGFFEILFSIIFSLVFLAAIYLAVILMATGKWFLELIDKQLMFMNISDSWSWGRFLLLFLLLFVLLSIVYRLTAPRRRTVYLFPGAFCGALALVVVSLVFSMFIGHSIRYPLVYGSLASVIILMFWLYCCSVVLFMGSALNVALEHLKE